jgi:DNA (cytosine-5)-methyltransferase 1
VKLNHNAINHNSSQADLFNVFTKGYKGKPYIKANTNFRHVDLFSGIGGFRLALDSIGTKCVLSCEWDKDAKRTYQANFGDEPFGDINSLKISQIPDFDILTGGFPCQPFSNIGLREGFKHKSQGNLFFNIADILEKKKPISFILENVGGLLTHKSNGTKTVDVIFSKLEEIGYEVNYKILNSADFGVPQIRKRIFIVGFLKKYFLKQTNFQFPEPKKNKVFIKDFLEKHSEGYNISKHLQKSYIYKKKDKFPQIINSKSKLQVKTLVSTYHKIQRITGTFVEDGKTGLRLFSENECKAIMGFPKKFIIPVSRTQMYRQMGNAVVVSMVKEVAKEVLKVLNRLSTNEEKKYKKSA